MEKVSKEIFNVKQENIEKLKQLFPSAIKDGLLDVKALKEELGTFEEVGQEKYEMNWAGKQKAKQFAQQAPLGKTLKYVKGDGINEDTTENIYIEGDNLEVLKLLRKNYYGSIKMIYIDPPYNTGNDFVYKDNFGITQQQLETAQGQRTEEGEKLQKNTKEGNAKYHTNWLNMMYPRLKLAKDLLTDDGVIFISIDENEVCNMIKICNEIFDESNFIENFIWIKNSTKNLSKTTSTNHEYVLCYSKSRNCIEEKNIFRVEKPGLKEVKEILEKSQKQNLDVEQIEILLNKFFKDNPDLKGISQYNHVQWTSEQKCYQVYTLSDISAPKSTGKADTYEIIHPKTKKPVKIPSRGWAFKEKTMEEMISKNLIEFYNDENHVPRIKRFLNTVETDVVKSFIIDNTDGKKENAKLFGTCYFDNPKPTTLLNNFIKLIKTDDIILDFFSGSATTAHAVIQLNAEDGGNRKFIMVQLPESCDEKNEAYKAGYKNICEIGKERIRRAGKKIQQENPDKQTDIGFKVFKIDDTTLNWEKSELEGKDLYSNYNENNTEKDKLDFTPGFTDLDVVYEIMLRQEGLSLTSKIEQLTDIGSRTYLVANSYLICLEENITEEIIKKLSELEPLPIKFVFRDSAFDDDIALKDESFRRLSALIDKNKGATKQVYTIEFI